MEKSCYGPKPIFDADINSLKGVILMATLGNLSLNNFIDENNRFCLTNESTNNAHTFVLRTIVDKVSKIVNDINDQDKIKLNIDVLLNSIIVSSYKEINPELLCFYIGKILFEDNNIIKSDKVLDILDFNPDKATGLLIKNLESYIEETDLENLDGDMWSLAQELINLIKDINE